MADQPSTPSTTPRSGDLVVQTGLNWAPLLMLLAPFIDGAISYAQAHWHYVVLDHSYTEVVKGAILAYAPVLLALRHMRQIHAAVPPPPSDPPLDQLQRRMLGLPERS